MSKSYYNNKLSLVLTLVVAFTIVSIPVAFGQQVKPGDVARAGSMAKQAVTQADRAEATAEAAKLEAVAQATAVGTQLRQELSGKETNLRNAIGAARGAAAAGDRNLERKFRAEADKLNADIAELKKKAQHTCAAFTDPTAQKDCLKSVETMHLDDNKVENAKVTAQADVAKAEITAKTAGTQAMFDFGKDQLDAVKVLETGCLPTTVTANGATKVEVKCPDKMRKGGNTEYLFDHIGGPNGIQSMVIRPAQVSKTSKWGKVLGFGALGGVAGGALGFAFFPNRETLDDGSEIHRNYTGPIAGAAIGFAATALATLVIEELTE